MSDEKSKKTNGNGDGEKEKIAIIETPEEKKARIYENRKGQYILFRLAEILNIDPTQKPPKPAMMIIETEGLYFNLVEILEKALKVIEGIK